MGLFNTNTRYKKDPIEYTNEMTSKILCSYFWKACITKKYREFTEKKNKLLKNRALWFTGRHQKINAWLNQGYSERAYENQLEVLECHKQWNGREITFT